MATLLETRQDICEIPPGADAALFTEVYNALPYLIRESDKILLGDTVLRQGLGMYITGPDELEIGKQPCCMFASDAVTRVAERIGLPAAREDLEGSHCITYFGDPEEPPSKRDIILCRTWGQFAEETYDDPEHPYGGRPFLGTREQLAALLPPKFQYMLEPESVLYRSVTHRVSSIRPTTMHEWLRTTPQYLAAYRSPVIGELPASDTTYPDHAWGY